MEEEEEEEEGGFGVEICQKSRGGGKARALLKKQREGGREKGVEGSINRVGPTSEKCICLNFGSCD